MSNHFRPCSLIVHWDRFRTAVGLSVQTTAWTGSGHRSNLSEQALGRRGENLPATLSAADPHRPGSWPARSQCNTVSYVTGSRRVASRTFR